MNILVTHQFNLSMARLSRSQQQEASKLFSFMSSISKEDILNYAMFTKTASKGEGIYTLRGQNIRIYCTFDADDNVLFLDVEHVDYSELFKSGKEEEETTLFDRNGGAIGYIAWNDENTIYTFSGRPLAYIDESKNIYGFNGKHLGWFEEDIVWNHQGLKVGYTKQSSPVFTQFEPFKGFKQFKPFKGLKQLSPLKPMKNYTNSSESLLGLLEEGR